MMTKAEELEAAVNGRGCLGRSADDEPVFILVGRDRLAASIVRTWAHQFWNARVNAGTLDARAQSKYDEALALATRMDAWREAHDGGKVPD